MKKQKIKKVIFKIINFIILEAGLVEIVTKEMMESISYKVKE